MSRFQMSINVADAKAAVDFYTKLLGVGPAKQRDGYANFIVADPPMKLVVVEDEGEPGTINHLGIEYPDGQAVADKTRLVADAGLEVSVDDPHTCCYATQEKAWTSDPDGLPWEVYTVVADTDHFGASPRGGVPVDRVLPPVDTADVVEALASKSAVVIDAQGDTKFDSAHIPGAVDFKFGNIAGQAEAIIADKDQRIIVYCTDAECTGSEIMGTALVAAGYRNVRRYPGGMAQWVADGQTVSQTESV